MEPIITYRNYYENLPSRWVKTYIRNIISLTSGTDLTPEEYSPDNIGVPYLTGASNISEDNSIKLKFKLVELFNKQ